MSCILGLFTFKPISGRWQGLLGISAHGRLYRLYKYIEAMSERLVLSQESLTKNWEKSPKNWLFIILPKPALRSAE